MDENEKPKPMGQVIQIDEARIRDHLGEMVRGTVEEALNAMLDAEVDRLCGASKYERTEGRKDTRAGSYERSLETKAACSGSDLVEGPPPVTLDDGADGRFRLPVQWWLF